MHTIARHLQILAAVLLTTAFAVPGHAQAVRTPVSVVLVHGAFQNSAIWSKVITIPAAPGRQRHRRAESSPSVAADAQNTRRVLDDQRAT